MAYQNFIPTVWNEAIMRETERRCVFAEDTNRQYEGDVKKMGDSVRILGISRPTIYTTKDKEINLTDPETVEDVAFTMNIKNIAYFNYKVDDIDRRQAVGGIMEALAAETSEALANVIDTFIANMSEDPMAMKDEEESYVVTKENVLDKVDKALATLYEHDVPPTSNITLTVSPRFYMILKAAYVDLDTNNSRMMENGVLGKYGNITVKMSNNVCKTGEGGELIQLKTDKAIAFVNPMTHTEAYRPENQFSDAVKGFILYDGMIIRPLEMVVLNVRYE